MKTIDDLLASISRTNNGYLFAPTNAEINIARQHPDLVKIDSGKIACVDTKINRYPDPKLRNSATPDEFDYELATLARQSAQFV